MNTTNFSRQRGLLEISSKSVKRRFHLIKETELHGCKPSIDSVEDVYPIIRELIKKLTRKHDCFHYPKCILTGTFAMSPVTDDLMAKLQEDMPNTEFTILSGEEQLYYSYLAFIDEEKKKNKILKNTEDIFVEISEDTVRIGLYKEAQKKEFCELNLGLNLLKEAFDASVGNVSSRFYTLADEFGDKCLEAIEGLKWDLSENYRVIFAGGSPKALIGGQDSGKDVQGKTRSIDTISEKRDEKIAYYDTLFEDNPKGIWEDNHYAKIMYGVLSSIYINAILQYYDAKECCFSGYGTIDGYYHHVVIGYTRHFRFQPLYKCLSAGKNVFICGPTGSGKTTAVQQCAKALKRTFKFTGAVSNEYKLLGYMDANGNYVSTEFRQAYEHGGIFLFDEVDASFPQPLLALNAALSGDEMDFPDKIVPKHKDFICVATANTFGEGANRQYVGRNQLDAAFLDRFVYLDWPYDLKLERNLTCNEAWAERVISVRKAIEKLGIRHIVSPRATINGAELLDKGLDQDLVEEMVLWRGLDRSSVELIKNNLSNE